MQHILDRLRENLKGGRVRGSYLDLVNRSINQTLSRTLLTAGPTLLACLALYFLGGEVLNGIAFALFVVIGIGNTLVDVSGITLMQRTATEDVLARWATGTDTVCGGRPTAP